MTEIGKIIDKIRNYETIVIHRHVRPDPDAYGSQAGLKEIITASFPGKQVFAAGMEDPACISLYVWMKLVIRSIRMRLLSSVTQQIPGGSVISVIKKAARL